MIINVFGFTDDSLVYKKSYPNFIKEIRNNKIIFYDGQEIIYDKNIKTSNFEELLNNCDLKSQISIKYNKGKLTIEPKEDPGRVRYDPFFEKMYGKNEKEVQKNLVSIDWMPNIFGQKQKLLVTKINGVSDKLSIISQKLEKLPKKFHKCAKLDGGYNYRKIAATNRKSAHSWGIAIDIGLECADYWLWSKDGVKDGVKVYKNRMPQEIVDIFENEGFIWGGKWKSFDTMHFEYRPELF